MNDDIKVPNEFETPKDLNNSSNKGLLSNLSTHLVDFIQSLAVFGAIFVLIYIFVGQPHKVSGASMFPTFKDGEYILTEKISYRLGNPERGDIVVFKNPKDKNIDFIKRVLALPGDTIKLQNNLVFVNGKKLNESYLPPRTITFERIFLSEGVEVKAGINQYFVFGDNREHSSDSREWGPITREEIIGKVLFRYFPISTLGLISHHPSN